MLWFLHEAPGRKAGKWTYDAPCRRCSVVRAAAGRTGVPGSAIYLTTVRGWLAWLVARDPRKTCAGLSGTPFR